MKDSFSIGMILVLILVLINCILDYISRSVGNKYVFGEMLLELFVCSIVFCVGAKGENFPSLLSANATLAVIIDKEYLGDEYETIKSGIESYLIYAKREILKHGGVNAFYYSWTKINLKKDFTAILSIASCSDTWSLFRSADSENIFHMAISEADCPRLPPDKGITVPIITRGEELPQLLLDLRTFKAYKWKSAAILYDETLSRDQITRVARSLTSESGNLRINTVAISLMKLNTSAPKDDIRKSIKDLFTTISVQTIGRNFLAIVSHKMVPVIMEYARNFSLVNTKNQWLYIASDTNFRTIRFDDLKELLREGDNVAFLYNNTKIKTDCKGGLACHTEEILIAFNKALEESILFEIDTANQVSDEEWEAIRPTKIDRRNSLLQSVKSYLLQHGLCDNCTSWLMKTGDTWGREYLLNASAAELVSVGSWRPSDGPLMTDELFLHIAHRFRMRNLPLISFHNPPWQVFRVNDSGAVTEYTGLFFEVIKELAKNLNFSYSIEIIDLDHELLYSSSNVTKSNSLDMLSIVTNYIPSVIMEMVMNKTVAFGSCAFTITENSKHFINFTSPISTQTYSFLVSRPRELSRALLFMSPFSGDTWLCLSASIVSMGPILYYIHLYSPVYEYKGIAKKGGLSSVQNCIWYMYGALLQQGGMHLPYADSARIIVGAWWLVVLVVATTYCGNLVAFLTFPKVDIPITTVDDLLAHRDTVTWSMIKGSYLEAQLKTTSDPKYRTLYEGKINKVLNNEIVDSIKAGKHVFIDWKIRLQHIMKRQYLETDRCDLALGLDEFYDEQLAMIVAKDSPYLEIINDEIKKLHQVGLIQKWLKDFLPKRDRCWKNKHIIEVNNHTVNMDDMQGSFFVLLLGFLISLLIIFSEKLWYNLITKKKSSKVIQPFTS